MKKTFVSLMAILMSAMTVMAERVTPEDAALVANNFMNATKSVSSSAIKKSAPAKRMVRKNMADDNLYYLYENENGEGWVIIAADDAVTPILAFSETGHFRTDNMPSNIQNWMKKYNNFIRKIEEDGVQASEETANEWKHIRKGTIFPNGDGTQSDETVGPLIKTTWDQGRPYWNLCPGTGSNKAATGCVATAMAQVMKYHEWPIQGTGSHSYRPADPNDPYSYGPYDTQSANFGETTYDWVNMKNSYSGNYATKQATAVATLMYHCGVATEMMYGDDNAGGSGTYTVNYGDPTWGVTTTNEGGCAQNALWAFFGYDKDSIKGYMRDGYADEETGYMYYNAWTDEDWTAMIKAELAKKRPIMYGGASDEGGHSFICDGYKPGDYFHFNWGWSGTNDGWFKLSSLKPGSGGMGGGGYDFSEDQDVLIGIVPKGKPTTELVDVVSTEKQAKKRIENGQVVIIRDNTKYTILGQKIQ